MIHRYLTIGVLLVLSGSTLAGSVLFSEDFNDGNYDGWTYHQYWSYSKGTIITDVSNGYWYVRRYGGGGAHGNVGIRRDLDLPVAADTYVEFDIHAIYSSVRNYTGDGNGEFPAVVTLGLDTPDGAFSLILAYSEDNVYKPDRSGATYYQVTNMNSGFWKYDERYTIRDYVPQATRITSIDLYGVGWSFTGEWDNIVIVGSQFGGDIPEPATMLAIGGSLAGIGRYLRKRK